MKYVVKGMTGATVMVRMKDRGSSDCQYTITTMVNGDKYDSAGTGSDLNPRGVL